MRVRLRLFAGYRDLAGANETTVEVPPGSNLEEDIAALLAGFPRLAGEVLDETGRIKDPAIVLLNGRNIRDLPREDAVLHERDEVSLFPPVAGGAGAG